MTTLRITIAAFSLVFLSACASGTSSLPSAPPAPTVDVGAIQTRAVSDALATQTASVPMATNTSLPTKVPPETSTPSATETPNVSESIPARGKYNHTYEVKEEYDRIKDITVVTLNYRGNEPDPGGLWVDFEYPGTKPATPATVDFVFVSSHDTWKYLRCHDLSLLLDDTVRIRPTTKQSGSVQSGYVIEEVIAPLVVSDFLQIVNAQKVEGVVCNDQFILSAEQMQGLKDVASPMKP